MAAIIANESGRCNVSLYMLVVNGFYLKIEWMGLAMKIESSSIAPQARIAQRALNSLVKQMG
ncbi:hypothetical protein VB10N_46070 [Vibrio sp. 10N]|nr:hypothetical protein VB10N_46070 [Vibrio sp. 10N]